VVFGSTPRRNARTAGHDPSAHGSCFEVPRRLWTTCKVPLASGHGPPGTVKVPSKDTAAVIAALARQVRKLPAALRCSLTWDRGLEMAKHKTFTVATNVKVYFCDPHSPWQRGTNENTNRLLRQYFPKRTNL
jgi:hypothetical protein